MKFRLLPIFILSIPLFGQVSITCPLYGKTPQCAGYVQAIPFTQTTPAPQSAHTSAPETQEQQNYETGQALGTSFGSAIFYKAFPGWRRRYCAGHPNQTFYYGNARGDKITGVCPTQDHLADEAATEWMAKHPRYSPSADNGAAMDQFVANAHLPRWEPKSYEKAFKSLAKEGKLKNQ